MDLLQSSAILGLTKGWSLAHLSSNGIQVIENIQTSVFINNEHIKSAPSNNVLRGPMAAVAYLIDQAAARNITLPKGCMICSGAITGVHDTVAGASATVSFEGIGNINMKLIPVTP